MSQLIGRTGPDQRIGRNDTSIQPTWWTPEAFTHWDWCYGSSWWGKLGSQFTGAGGVDVEVFESPYVERVEPIAGASSRYGVSGVTRDIYGSPLGGVTVKIFKTSDDSLVSTIVSDANTGAFIVTTPYYPDTHYIVTYKAGSPDTFGTSVNTLTGA